MDDEYDDERPEVRGVLTKALAVVAVVALVVALGTTLMVRALGLDEGESAGSGGSEDSASGRTLPTTALPVPGQSASPGEPSDLVSPEEPAEGTIELSVTPVLARAMERVNLTGVYPGHDNVGLQVQRWENGQWSDFGVSATVRADRFATYVMTGREGKNRFRVFDPQAGAGSNPVVVTIG